jgi:CheY-like chemotaxis protein
MREIIEWLMKIETLAGDFYSHAGAHYSQDRPLQGFLEAAAKDEAWHHQVMASALDDLDNAPDIQVVITLDPEFCRGIEAGFVLMQNGLSNGTLTKERLLEGIAEAEFSEWNEIFLYVVNSLKQSMKKFNHVAVKIENHKRGILRFFEEVPEGSALIDRLRRTPPIWRERILIVEDDEALRELLVFILKQEGAVEAAPNGRIAVEMARASYFRLIISDIDMPEMNGFQMFDALRNDFPTIPYRFVFMSGNGSAKLNDFIAKHGLDFLPKPSSIRQIRECVQRHLTRDFSIPY